ncbi:metal iron transporter, partial [Phenoliferia sp. Uapishka_3]
MSPSPPPIDPPPIAAAEPVSLNDESDEDLPQRKRREDASEKIRATGGRLGKRRGWLDKIKRHAAFVGPGIIASVAYIDPGNWSTDLQAGSGYGYSHLFIILLVGFLALLFQILATRLGCVSGIDLAEHCRLALYDRPKNKMLWRWGVLYPLYAMAEMGIIFTDLAELLGSAIAINLLIPKIPLWACVVLTSLDVLLILVLFSQYPTKMVTRSMRLFELVIGLLVLAVLGSFVALLVKVSPVWRKVFHGYVPGPGIIRGGGLYIAVGILGATVMPHAMFIGSKMACMRRLKPEQYEVTSSISFKDDDETIRVEEFQPSGRPRRSMSLTNRGPSIHLPQPISLGQFSVHERRLTPEERRAEDENGGKTSSEKGGKERTKPTLECVKAHLGHAVADIAGSLLGFAVLINSAILILAAAVFYYGEGKSSSGDGISDLFDAYALIKAYVGPAFGYIFAVALLAAGQSASLTVTLSGQIVSEGFLQWRTKPWKRRLITRSIGIVPSLAVAIAVGRDGVSNLLVGSQVALSIILPFVLGPLILLTSSHGIMSLPNAPSPPPIPITRLTTARTPKECFKKLNPFRRRIAPSGWVSFASSPWVIWLAWAVWSTIVIANVFAIVDLARGAQ